MEETPDFDVRTVVAVEFIVTKALLIVSVRKTVSFDFAVELAETTIDTPVVVVEKLSFTDFETLVDKLLKMLEE